MTISEISQFCVQRVTKPFLFSSLRPKSRPGPIFLSSRPADTLKVWVVYVVPDNLGTAFNLINLGSQ